MNRWAAPILAIFYSLLAIPGSCHAQTVGDPALQDGLAPYQSWQAGDIDAVNLLNLKVNLHIPLVSYPQRGGKLHLGFYVSYTNQLFHETLLGAPCEIQLCEKAWSVKQGGIGITPDFGPFVSHATGANDGVGWVALPDNISFLPLALTTSGSYITVDGSGYSVTSTPITTCSKDLGVATTYLDVVKDNQGIQTTSSCFNPPSLIEDPNGNKITVATTSAGSTFTDSLNRTIPSFPQRPFPTGSCPSTLWTVPTLNGGTTTYQVCTVDIYTNPNFPVCGPIPTGSIDPSPEKNCIYTNSVPRVQSITLPNGTAWTFEYDAGNPNNPGQLAYGDLTKITFPAGGSISYVWQTGLVFEGCPSAPTSDDFSRALASRTVDANDGTGPHTWTYSYQQLTSGGATPTVTETIVTDPLGNQTIHTFTSIQTCDFYETETQYFQNVNGTQVLQKTVLTDYNSTANSNVNIAANVINVLPIRVTTEWPNGQQSKVEKDYTFDVPLSNVGGATSGYGNVVAMREYDYGSGAPGPLLRQTATTYQYQNAAAYKTNNLVTLPATVKVTDGGGTQRALTTYGYDAGTTVSSGITTQHDSAPPDGTARGNQTSVARWLNTTGGSLTSSASFFDTGEVQTSTDPKGNSTTFAYSSTYAGAYPTTVTNALAQSTTHAYDFNAGLLTSTTDPNGQTTSFTYDNMWRLAAAAYPDGGAATITRQEAAFPFTATLTKKITSSLNYVMTNTFDGVGRVSESLVTDPQGNIETDTTYDADGRKYTVSNPYRTKTDSTYGVTTYVYDALGRTCVVIPPDGTAVANTSCPTTQPSNDVFTVYAGNTTTVTDQQGKSRESQTDGLGRLTTVWENPSGLDYETVYTYDALDDLATVVQGGSHNRSFVYDSLKRLTSSTNPEAGAVTYTYDADGNVTTKLDARGITITYGYDKLSRLTGKTYSNSDPSVGYTYDQSGCLSASACFNIGRRTSMTDAAGSESWAYDKVGRELAEQRITNSLTKSTGYTYNLDGTLATLTYPSGRTITYTTDAVERTSKAADVANGINYAMGSCSNGASSTGVCYAPQGAVALIDNGASLATTTIYNDRLQPCWIYATSGTALAKTTSCTATATAGTVLDMKYNFALGTADNGNVMGITNDIDNTRSQSFTYDQVNRIVTAQTPSSWSQSFTYDQWANLTTVAATGSAPPLSLSVNANNQITTPRFSYDAAGNETSDVTSTYEWNAEGQLKTAGGVTYTYDGDGKRVEKSSGKLYWYGTGSDALMETDLSGNLTDEYIFFGGKRVARRDASASIVYYVTDHLGTSRVVTNATGGILDQSDFYPFGGEHVITSSSGNTYKFTGKERDSESNLDNFGARYSSSTIGRFMSPDPKSAISHILDPQTFNRYAYTRDNPLVYVDPNGRDLAKAWEDIKAFGRSISIKVSIGVGWEAKVTRGAFEAKAGVAYKANIETSQDDNLKISRSVSLGGAAGQTNGVAGGENAEAEKPVLTVDNNNNVTIGGPVEGTVTDTIGGNTTTLNGSSDKVAVGVEGGILAVAGGEVGTTKQGLAALKDAAHEIKDSVQNVPPPPTPPPPRPPDN